MQKASKIILGIDPGTIIMGYGLIEIRGTSIHLMEMNVLKLSSKNDAYEKLEKIHAKVQQLINTYKPNHFAIEAPFFGKNVQSMLKLGRAQGVAIAAAIQAGLTVHEYSPKKIKQSITGNGNAGKDQVMKMLQHLLKFEQGPAYMDASDALAVAVCHHFQQNAIPAGKVGKSMASGWKEFLLKNPARVK
ncbi:MAG: crossover junction endodeoxyribonuclease RuvC [Ferruginibacter sp.]